MDCFVRSGKFIWPSNWIQNATYLGPTMWHNMPVDAYSIWWTLMSVPTPNYLYVSRDTGLYVGWEPPLGGLVYQWFTYQSLNAFPTSTFFDAPRTSKTCSSLSIDNALPWR